MPPPYFGPSVCYHALLHSTFTQHWQVTFVDLTVVQHIAELEQFRVGKLLKLVGFILTTLWHLLSKRFDLCSYPIAYNRKAFLKDWTLLSLVFAFRVPAVLYIKGRGLPEFRRRLSPYLRRHFETMVRRAAGAIVVAEDIRAELDGLLPPSKVLTIIQGLEPQSQFTDPPARNSGGFTVLYLGALYRRKGLFTLLEAFRQVREQRPDARLVLAGDWFPASEREPAEDFLKTHNLTDAVQLTGPVFGDAKWRLYSEADAFVFVTEPNYEAFGLVLLEAMQAWLPIVASRGGARSELVTDGVNGFLAAHDDSAAVANYLLRLAADPVLRERMGRAGRERFAAHYTHEQYGQRLSKALLALSGETCANGS